MRKYSASWGARLTFGLIGFGMLLFGIWMFATLMRRPFNSIGAQIFFLYFLVAIAIAPSLLFLYGFAETLATYNVSEEKITKWTLFGTREIFWRNLSDYQIDKDNDYRLFDHRNNKLDVNLSLISRTHRDSLREMILTYLKRTEPERQRLLSVGKRYRPTPLWAAIFLLPFALLILVLAIGGPILIYEQGEADSVGAWIVMVVAFLMFGGMGGLLGYFGLKSLTQTIFVTDADITDTSLFGRTRLAFADIDTLAMRQSQDNNGRVIEFLTLKSGAQKIKFTSQIVDYALILTHIRSRAVNLGIVKEDRLDDPVRQAKDRKQAKWALAIFTIVGLAMGGWFVRDGYTLCREDAELRARGVSTNGVVTGREERGSKTTTYYLFYDYRVNGRNFTGRSSVFGEVYRRTQRGNSADVLYLPDKPGLSELANTNARRLGYINLFQGGLLLFFTGVLYIPSRKKKAAAPLTSSAPTAST